MGRGAQAGMVPESGVIDGVDAFSWMKRAV